MTRRYSIEDASAIPAAAGIVKAGGVIIYPTETVYGLGASALSIAGMDRLYSLKGRDKEKPVSILIGSMTEIDKWCHDVNSAAKALMQTYWPGPLTIVFKASQAVPASVQTESGTIGIRYPAHLFCQNLAATLGYPLTATSANPSGAKPARTIAEVDAGLAARVDLLIDGGTCAGTPSTVIDVTREPAVILREGAIAGVEIRLLLQGIQ